MKRVLYYLTGLAAVVARRRIADPDWLEAHDLAERMRTVLTKTLGRTSNWTGDLEIIDGSWFLGHYTWENSLVLSRNTFRHRELLPQVVLHELLHSYSVDNAVEGYEVLPGWEEGVVEGLARVLLPDVVAALDLVSTSGTLNSYNHYVKLLDRLVDLLGVDRRAFYLEALSVPLEDRPAWVQQMIKRRRGKRRRELEAHFKKAKRKLRRRL